MYLPQSGEIKLFNQTISDRTIFDNVSFLQDSSVLYPYLSAKDHLYFIADIHKIPRKRVIDSVEYLDMTDYWERNVKFYSLGMKQRTLLAIGLISNSKLLFLDEPLNGLDPTSMILIREAIKKMANNGQTILISSHNLNEIDKVTHDILFIKNQKVWLENIYGYQKNILKIRVDTKIINKTKEMLEINRYDYQANGTSFEILSHQEDGADIINLLIQNNLQITSFEKYIAGSEQRYKELFGVKSNGST
ncbi:ATP-binding cassette domain-containing protein [Vagococcus acidifermentans]|uniref:ATP-binding cassette domain-containing protein n=1 Tax=Vagococcus acidifermentans TaxID=564710 RepID=UPI001FE8B3F4|nr:ABC transporter ATP-binding protein [Vagococcus acidifermentans]